MSVELFSMMPDGTEAQLVDHMVKGRRLLIPATQPDKASAVVPWSAVNELIANGTLPHEYFRLIRSNRHIPYEMFCRPGDRPEVRARALQQLVAQGVSVIINRIDKYVPTVGALCAGLERRLGHDVHANCYISFAKESAFLAHHDGHDVIIFQVHGRKNWRTFGMAKEGQANLSAQEVKELAPQWEQTLSPGDMLFLPRGEIHDASALSSDSLHLTIGIHQRRGTDLVRWLVDRNQTSLDMSLTRLGGSQRLSQQEERLKQHLHALVDKINLNEYLWDEDTRRTSRTLVSLPLTQELSPTTRVVLLLRRIPSISDSNADQLSIVIGGENIKLSRNERAILPLLYENPEVRYGEIEARLADRITAPDLAKATRALATSGLVALIADGAA